MKMKLVFAIALLLPFADLAFALCDPGSNGLACRVPEIDGSLAIQAIALLGGVVYLLKRKK